MCNMDHGEFHFCCWMIRHCRLEGCDFGLCTDDLWTTLLRSSALLRQPCMTSLLDIAQDRVGSLVFFFYSVRSCLALICRTWYALLILQYKNESHHGRTR